MTSISTIKKFAASTAIASFLGLGGLGVATGIAAAAPSDGSNAGPSTSSSSDHAHPATPGKPKETPSADDTKIAHLIPGFTPTPATGNDDPTIPAHLIPGFTPKPVAAPGNGLGSTLDPGQVCERGHSCPVQHG